MQHSTPDAQPAAGEARQWQIKWGTRDPLQVGDAMELRVYGYLDVDVASAPQLAACLGAKDEQELLKAARGRLREMVLLALQEALDKLDALAFPDHSGSLAPEYVEQATAGASASLRAQLAEMGLELQSLAIGGNSYQHTYSYLKTGGDDCAGCRAMRIQLGLEKPAQPPPPGLMVSGISSELGRMMQQAMMQSPANPPPASPDADVMTQAEVAACMQLTEAEVIELIESGQLKGKKIGPAYRVSRKSLEEYLRAQRAGGV